MLLFFFGHVFFVFVFVFFFACVCMWFCFCHPLFYSKRCFCVRVCVCMCVLATHFFAVSKQKATVQRQERNQARADELSRGRKAREDAKEAAARQAVIDRKEKQEGIAARIEVRSDRSLLVESSYYRKTGSFCFAGCLFVEDLCVVPNSFRVCHRSCPHLDVQHSTAQQLYMHACIHIIHMRHFPFLFFEPTDFF